jgi:hypothetical protein
MVEQERFGYMVEGKRRVFKPKLETKVRREEFQKVSALAAMEGKTKSEVVREERASWLRSWKG